MRIKNQEQIKNNLIKIYERDKNENIIENYLEDENSLFQKFKKYEELLIKNFAEKEKINKEIKNLNIKEKTEINILNNKVNIFQKELSELNKKYKKILLLINKYNNSENNFLSDNEDCDINIKESIEYINEIGKCLGIGIDLKNKINRNILLIIKYCKNIIKSLGLKERKIDECINLIDNVLKYGEKEDKELILKALSNAKKENKYKKLLLIKQEKEELNYISRLKTIKRLEKNIIKGRKVYIYSPPNKNYKNDKKIIKNYSNNDENEYLYYSSEDIY